MVPTMMSCLTGKGEEIARWEELKYSHSQHFPIKITTVHIIKFFIRKFIVN